MPLLPVIAGFVNAPMGGASAWGAITGTLSAQADLQAALDAKQTASTLGSAAFVNTTAFDAAGAAAAAQSAAIAASQPLDSDLTAIAALSTTVYGRALLALVDAAAGRTAFGLGTMSTQAAGTVAITGGTMAGVTITGYATTGYVDTAVTGLLDFKGATDCSASPNYPAASKGDTYIVSVAGKIGGASGTSVDAGDTFFATADNAGGTEASVGTSWGHIEHNLPALGTFATQNFATPPAIGGTTPAAGSFTTLAASGAVVATSSISLNGGANPFLRINATSNYANTSWGRTDNLDQYTMEVQITSGNTASFKQVATTIWSTGGNLNTKFGVKSQLVIGGDASTTMSTLPMLKANSGALNLRLGDDSADTGFTCGTLASSGAVSFTGGSLTGGAGNFTFTAGTGNSRTLIFQTTTSGGVATTALTLGADQSATFAGALSASGAIAFTGTTNSTSTSTGTVVIGNGSSGGLAVGQNIYAGNTIISASLGGDGNIDQNWYGASFGGSNGNTANTISAKQVGSSAVTYVNTFNLYYRTGGPSAGWGPGLKFVSQTDSGAVVNYGAIEIPTTTITNGSHATDFVIKTATAGTMAESLRVVGATKTLQLKTGTQNVKVGGAIFDDFTAATSTSTNGTEDDLFTHTLVASTLGTNGDKVEQVEHVSFVSSATAARRIKKYFGGTLIFDSTALTLSLGGEFDLFTTVIRVSSTAVSVAVSVTSTSASSIPYSTFTSVTGLTLSNTQILKTTGIASGTGAASGDIINRLSSMVWLPAAS